MSDPAVEAAQRAWAAMAQDMPWTDGDGECEELVTAAREALAPIKPLIEDARRWTPDATHEIGDAYHADTVHDLLDELSRLIYTDDELENQ